MVSITNDDEGVIVGANNLIRFGLGAELTQSSGVIEITDSLHYISGSGTITTINVSGGNPPGSAFATFIRNSNQSVEFGTGGNISQPLPVALVDGVPYIAFWDGVTWRFMDANSGILNVQDYGVVPTSSAATNAANLNALTATLLAAGRGATLHFPRGAYDLGEITVNSNSTRFVGDGMCTSLNFVPTANNQTLLTFTKLTATTIGYCGIEDLQITCANTSYTKTAIKVIDVTTFCIDNVFINNWRETTTHTAIGLDARGREFLSTNRFISYADRPIVINDNPNSTIDSDHFHFHNTLLGPVGNPGFEVADNINVTEITIDGYFSIAGGTHGFYMVDTLGGAGVNGGITISNLRWEQATAAGYMVYISKTGPNVQRGVVINRCRTGSGTTNKGIYLRGLNRATLNNCVYEGTIEALNADAIESLELKNCYWNTGSTFNMGSLKKLGQGDKGSGASEPGQGIEIWTNATASGWSFYGPITTLGGGTVTQGTSAVTAVSLNTPTGAITTVTQNIAAGAEVQFTVNNSTVTTASVPTVAIKSGSVGGTTVASVTAVASGSFQITLTNLNGATAETGALVINYVVFGGSTS